MTGHLDLDALADLAARDGGVRAVGPHESHLAECDTCRARLDALRDRSAVVATRLAEGAGSTPPAMPADVNERITAALAAAGVGEGAQTAGPAVASRRRRWSTRLAVAATVLVIGGAAVPVAVHLNSRPSGSAESTAASAADSAAGGSVSAGTAAPQSPTELSSAAFGVDVRALLARRSSASAPGKQQAAGAVVESACRRVATSAARRLVPGASTAGPVSVHPITAVTVDGRPADLMVVDVAGRQAAVAVDDCRVATPAVLAATLL